MPQALTLSPVIRKYGINLGAPYRPLSIRIRLKQIKLAGPALCQEPVFFSRVCVCVCVGGGGAAVNNIYKGCMDPHHCV